jgi:hypothetical protein
MTACRGCGRRIGADTYLITFNAATESTGTCLDYELCERCWERLREGVRDGSVPA